MSAEGGLEIGPLRPPELRAAAALLGRAFRENPMNRAVSPGSPERRERCNVAGMQAVLPLALRRARVLAARCDARPAGVLVALPPGMLSVGTPSWLGMLRLLAVQGLGVAGRWASVAEALQVRRPLAPHFYLATLGVDPERQRRGIGGALLTNWLASIDAVRQRAYLETDLAQNVSWYEGFGFTLRAELSVLGVAVYLMERSERDG